MAATPMAEPPLTGFTTRREGELVTNRREISGDLSIDPASATIHSRTSTFTPSDGAVKQEVAGNSGVTIVDIDTLKKEKELPPLITPLSTPASTSIGNDNKGSIYFLSWFLLNIGVTLLNKSVFSFNRFDFPLTLSATHMIACGVLSYIFVRQLKWFPENKEAMQGGGATRIYLFSILFTLNIVMGNLGIQVVSVALGQIIRAMIPGITMGLSFLILGQKPSMLLVASLIPICLGIVCTVRGDLEITVLGLVYTILGSFLSGLKVVITNKFLVGNFKMDPVDLLMRISPLAFAQIVVLIYFYEYDELRARWPEFSMNPAVWGAVWTTALMAFLLNITNFFANKYTSPLTLTVGGNVKQVMTIVLSIAIFNTKMTLLSGIGMLICTAGAAMYSFVKFYKL